MADIDALVTLQRAADAEHAALAGLDGEERAAQWEKWRAAAERSQAAVTEAAEGGNRYELAVKVWKTARHADEPAA